MFVSLGTVYAQDHFVIQNHPQPGNPIPHDLQSLDQNSQEKNFESLKGEKGLILVFVRSLQWCPFCQTQVIGLNENKDQLKNKGIHIAVISNDPVQDLAFFGNVNGISLTLLSDTQSEIIKAFGVLNANKKSDQKYYGIADPAVFYISAEGNVLGDIFTKDFKLRPPVEDIISLTER